VTRVFSGIQPSGDLHLGNHLGALVNWVGMQDRADCVYCVVDLHAMTSPAEHDPATLRQRTVDAATTLLAVGVDPQRSILFVQSHVHEHAECTWLFNCIAGFGELRKQPQFKEKSEGKESVSVGLFDYPVLQTSDILLYHATRSRSVRTSATTSSWPATSDSASTTASARCSPCRRRSTRRRPPA
jgi:tryptophanyl-tRNA synthetase